jgi:hypothetical protein
MFQSKLIITSKRMLVLSGLYPFTNARKDDRLSQGVESGTTGYPTGEENNNVCCC